LSLLEMGQYEAALVAWQELIDGHPGDTYWKSAYEEQSYTLWAFLSRYEQAAQVLLDYVARVPDSPDAADMLYQAARIQERDGNLEEAATTWERMVNEYPSNEQSLRGLFLSGISYYRLGDYGRALLAFQRMLVLAPDPEDQAAAYFWIGKTQVVSGEQDAAQNSWQQASQVDVTGYYSERARELLQGLPPLSLSNPVTLEYDLEAEKSLAEAWLRSTFAIPEEVSLDGLGALAGDPRMQLANALWELGEYTEAAGKFEIIRQENAQDATASFRLLNYLIDLGVYKQAILTCRQILDLANLSDADTLNVPRYFSHIRFGAYFEDDVLMSAEEENLEPILLYSVVRQESLFEGYAGSTAGALGLMQLIPSTGGSMSVELGWPAEYTTEDLFRPSVNIRLGSLYLEKQVEYFGKDQIFAALAAYNAGPGNAEIWFGLSNGDPDLFVEIIRYSETRNYVMQIAEFFYIYQRIYGTDQG
jgi:soluble lytic murein transglycosylase